MAKHPTKSAGKEKGTRAKEKVAEGPDVAGEEECRCKEVSKKTPLEMIKLMANDFAFWKKQKSSGPNKPKGPK